MRANRAATVLVVLLLTATAGAFAYTERLKLEAGPILRPRVDELLSPVCECEHSLAQIGFRLREAGCDYGQGFFISRPLPRADVETLLRRAVT